MVLLHAKGRGRAAKYHERRDAEQKYATRLLGLLTHERKEEERVAKERLEKWSDKRLEDAGLSLTGVRCARLPRGLYGRPVVRLSRAARGARRPCCRGTTVSGPATFASSRRARWAAAAPPRARS